MSDKTEAPTPRRLEEAREEGKVARSLELNSAAILIVGALLLQGPGAMIVNGIKNIIREAINAIPYVAKPGYSLDNWKYNPIIQVGPGLGLMLIVILAVGVSVTLSQTRFLWSTKKMGFDFSRINPLSGFQRIFSKQGLIELAKALLKLVWVGGATYYFLRDRIAQLIDIGETDLVTGLTQWTNLASSLAMTIGAAYLVLAIGDYAFQRWRFTQSLKMSKEEVKEDYKRSEGDPFIRGRIRAQQRKLARSRMMANVHKASVVVINPTHFAVAIAYDQDTMSAPRVMAKGQYLVAQRIVDLARSLNIPVIQNIPVARALYRAVEVGQEIPPDLYMAVAEILAYVYKLRGKAPRTAQAAGTAS